MMRERRESTSGDVYKRSFVLKCPVSAACRMYVQRCSHQDATSICWTQLSPVIRHQNQDLLIQKRRSIRKMYKFVHKLTLFYMKPLSGRLIG